MFALADLKRLIANYYKFSETHINIDAVQQYSEDSDSMLSFVKDCCERGESYASSSLELYLAHKSYCDESGMKPYSQKPLKIARTHAAPAGYERINRLCINDTPPTGVSPRLITSFAFLLFLNICDYDFFVRRPLAMRYSKLYSKPNAEKYNSCVLVMTSSNLAEIQHTKKFEKEVVDGI